MTKKQNCEELAHNLKVITDHHHLAIILTIAIPGKGGAGLPVSARRRLPEREERDHLRLQGPEVPHPRGDRRGGQGAGYRTRQERREL